MDLTQIRYFLALARTLNFTRAAEHCRVTQPTLTKAVQRLETELGGPLLLRERAHTQLTALGAAVLPLLQQSLDAAETARAHARHVHASDRQHLRLALGPGVDPAIALPVLQALRQRFATLELTVREGDAGALNAWLLASKVDVALTADGAALADRAHRWVLFADPAVALVPAACGQAGPVAAEALRGEPMVGRLDASDRALEDQYGLTPAIRHRGSTHEQVCMMVGAGLGTGLSTARRPVPSDLTRRPITPPHSVEVCVAALAGRTLSHAATAFLHLARARDWDEAA